MKRVALIFLALIIFSCERRNNGTSVEEKQTQTDILKKELNVMVDSVNGAWNEMIAIDDQKFKDIKRLLDEISYTKKYDMVAHESLVKQLDVIKSQRFNESLDLNVMDAYDSLTDAYILNVFKLKAATPDIEQHPIAEELVADISMANSVEVTAGARKKYDFWAKKYNQYLKTHKSEIEKLGEPYSSYKEKAEIIIAN